MISASGAISPFNINSQLYSSEAADIINSFPNPLTGGDATKVARVVDSMMNSGTWDQIDSFHVEAMDDAENAAWDWKRQVALTPMWNNGGSPLAIPVNTRVLKGDGYNYKVQGIDFSVSSDWTFETTIKTTSPNGMLLADGNVAGRYIFYWNTSSTDTSVISGVGGGYAIYIDDILFGGAPTRQDLGNAIVDGEEHRIRITGIDFSLNPEWASNGVYLNNYTGPAQNVNIAYLDSKLTDVTNNNVFEWNGLGEDVSSVPAENVNVYTSDYSGGVDGWISPVSDLISGNNDGISDGTTSYDNCFRIECAGGNVQHRSARPTMVLGNDYTGSTKILIPSTNANVNGALIQTNAGQTFATISDVGQWIDISEFDQVNDVSVTAIKIVPTVNGAGTFDSDGDEVYVVDFSIDSVQTNSDLLLTTPDDITDSVRELQGDGDNYQVADFSTTYPSPSITSSLKFTMSGWDKTVTDLLFASEDISTGNDIILSCVDGSVSTKIFAIGNVEVLPTALLIDDVLTTSQTRNTLADLLGDSAEHTVEIIGLDFSAFAGFFINDFGTGTFNATVSYRDMKFDFTSTVYDEWIADSTPSTVRTYPDQFDGLGLSTTGGKDLIYSGGNIAAEVPVRWTTGKGFLFDGVEGYLNTGFTPSTDGVNYELNDAEVQVYCWENIDETANKYLLGAQGSSGNISRITQNTTLRASINSTSNTVYTDDATFQNLTRYGVERNDSFNQQFYKNGVVVKTEADGSVGLADAEIFIGGLNNNGTPSTLINARTSYLILGGGFDNTALNTDLTLVETEFIV